MISAESGFPTDNAASRVEKSLDALLADKEPLANIISAFRGLLAESARLRAELRQFTRFDVPAVDPVRFDQGAPLVTQEELVQISKELEKVSVDRLFPAMREGFPKISEELEIVRQALAEGRIDPGQLIVDMLRGRTREIESKAAELGIDSSTVQFALSQAFKPIIESFADSLAPVVQGLSWNKGYCPICGSMPRLGLLKGEGGGKWLRCSLCAHEWRYARTVCPFCENDDQQAMEFYYVLEKEDERAEICHTCKRYLLTIDLRNRSDEIEPDVATLGLLHLDILVQQKGFLPMAVFGGSVVSAQDISSSESLFESPETPA